MEVNIAYRRKRLVQCKQGGETGWLLQPSPLCTLYLWPENGCLNIVLSIDFDTLAYFITMISEVNVINIVCSSDVMKF
jgi:hypothetical protein